MSSHQASAGGFGSTAPRLVVLVLLTLTALTAPAARAQFEAGSLYGTAANLAGEQLVGVALKLSGIGPERVQVSDEKGRFRFLGLDPGTYALTAELDEYAPVRYESVAILVGRTTSLQLLMSELPSETIVVTTEPALIAQRGGPAGLLVTRTELATIPTSRDPWAVADQAPGVLMSKVNVGGDQTGQQPAFVGPGAQHAENGFAIDGVVVTDMEAGGYSSTYYDFEHFDAVEVTVGGSDAATTNSGVLVNLTTRRGTNDWRFSARAFSVDSALQSSSTLDPEELPEGQGALSAGGFESLTETGIEGGGPLLRDRLWGWGAWGDTDLENRTVVDSLTATELGSWALKLHGRPGGTQSVGTQSVVAGISSHDKRQAGRGAGTNRAPETLWRQKGPFRLARLEGTRIFTNDFSLTALLSRVELGFDLSPVAGPDGEAVLDEKGVWRGGYATFAFGRDSDLIKLEGAAFLDGGRHGDHELAFGANRRRFEARMAESWGERQLINIAGENVGNDLDLVEALRPSDSRVMLDYDVLWLQDSWKTARRTLDLGLHYDLQRGRTPAIDLAANPVFPELLPAFRIPAHEPAFGWRSLSPRLGISYTVGESRRTILRASLSRFASQLNTALITRESPQGGALFRFEFDDLDGNGRFDLDEPRNLLSTYGVDPDDPSSALSPNQSSSGLDPELTDELVLGLKHELRPELVVGLDLSLRRVHGVLESRKLIRDPEEGVRMAEATDYRLDSLIRGTLPDGQPFEVPVYSLAAPLQFTGGQRMVNGDREQRYQGATLSLTKRLSRRWMLRGQLTASDWRWQIGPEFRRHDDPTDEATGAGSYGAVAADSDGDVVAQQVQSFGPSDGIFLNSTWSFNLSGAYQVAPDRPWGFVVAGRISGRQGFPLPLQVAVTPSDGRTRLVQVGSRSDQFRLDDLYLVDLRLEKEISRGRLSTTFGVDGFNLLGRSTVLQRSHLLNGPQPLFVEDVLGPRVFRIGVRLAWN